MFATAIYAAYLAISIGLTIWVARTLSKNGAVFLTDCFGHDEVLARSTNHLLVVGFYLVNLGFILLALQYGTPPDTLPGAIRFLSSKVGLAVIVLGAMHFFNMNAIAKFGRKVGAWFREEQWAAQARPAEPAG
ncbi:MAG: hypothetical protein H6920_09145 [Sphingomonadaceae bacterium]|nr:hypothetical protein [Altererythrobacter sp.]MCP5391772.1 hypothetical protein [Sphingomonadaceae bacterium]MCP5393068.1 hypothetical protein [Sphingomonadaceae bacterium]